MSRSELHLNPVETLLTTRPADDVGADTADRYEWQAVMATADVLGLYFGVLDEAGDLAEGVSFSVICEHHEDWAVVRGERAEIVSGKHREASVGPLSTYRQLLAEGGLLHLYSRWQALGKTPLCRLVTTGGLSADVARTARACERLRNDGSARDDDLVEVVGGLAGAITTLAALPVPLPTDTVRAFLASLRIDDAQPRRDQVRDLAGERYGRPVAERLGHPTAGNAVFQAVLALVRPRMRAAGPSTGGALPTVLGMHHDHVLSSRTLTHTDVDTAARFAVLNVAGYAPLPRIIKANLMAVKMAQGGCSDNAIERADSLRLQYRAYWRARRGTPSLSDQQRRLNNLLIRVVDDATRTLRSGGGNEWGAELWHELGDRFQALQGSPDTQGMSVDLLLGGVSELTNNCRAWYTDRFDAPSMLRRLILTEAAS
jgi:hypothetical protein